MSKSREKKAKKSLKWLRGWRTDDRVLSEYSDMQRYKDFIDACQPCRQYKMQCTHPPPTMTQNLKQLTRKKTIKPFLIFTLCEIFAYTSGSHHLQSYFVQIMNAYQSPIDPNQATVRYLHYKENFKEFPKIWPNMARRRQKITFFCSFFPFSSVFCQFSIFSIFSFHFSPFSLLRSFLSNALTEKEHFFHFLGDHWVGGCYRNVRVCSINSNSWKAKLVFNLHNWSHFINVFIG